MTKDEAAKILAIPINAKHGRVDESYHRLRKDYLTRAQYGTDPHEREVANNALARLQEAYRTFTGKTGPIEVNPRGGNEVAPSEQIPRASLSGKDIRQAPRRDQSPTKPGKAFMSAWRCTWNDVRKRWQTICRWRPPNKEKAVASAICAAMFIAALMILAAV